jgi:hypothetical protein
VAGLVASLAVAVGGCGGSARTAASARTLALSRSDLVAVCDALERAQGAVGAETAVTKRAWRLVANGLPRVLSPAFTLEVQDAAGAAGAVPAPAPLGEAQARVLTGPAAGLAGLFRNYALLTSRGWRMIAAAVGEIGHGAPAAARFARENVALYIDSVYDGHFTLAQVARKLIAGYSKLGGAAAFGQALTPQAVSALAGTYSEAAERLHPHVGVRFGS